MTEAETCDDLNYLVQYYTTTGFVQPPKPKKKPTPNYSKTWNPERSARFRGTSQKTISSSRGGESSFTRAGTDIQT